MKGNNKKVSIFTCQDIQKYAIDMNIGNSAYTFPRWSMENRQQIKEKATAIILKKSKFVGISSYTFINDVSGNRTWKVNNGK